MVFQHPNFLILAQKSTFLLVSTINVFLTSNFMNNVFLETLYLLYFWGQLVFPDFLDALVQRKDFAKKKRKNKRTEPDLGHTRNFGSIDAAAVGPLVCNVE